VKASERMEMLERAETRVLARLAVLSYGKDSYYWRYDELRFLIWERMKAVQHLIHLEERDSLWPDGLPAHP
jgi:hypothetical protein